MMLAKLLLALTLLCQPALAAIPTVASVDLPRYLGTWYEIARIPQPFELGCRCVQADYSLREPGTIGVVNTCRRGKGVSQVVGTGTVDPSNSAKLSVRFPPGPAGEYWIVALDPDYRHAMVSNSAGTSLWILSRARTLDAQVTRALLDQARGLGIDTARVVATDQRGCD